MRKYDLKSRSKQFAHNCIKLALNLPKTTLGNHLRNQLIRSSTSVAANYRAVCLAQSQKSFVAKLSIVIEEADESEFWLEFVRDEKLIHSEQLNQLLQEAHELASIFISSRKTARNTLNT